MAELTQSVVVCNLDGAILLYNSRARAQFRAWSSTPATAGGAELIGLGRSIYAVFDRPLIAHALESVRQRMRDGAASPSAQFVTGTPAGRLLRVQMAPVHDPAARGRRRRRPGRLRPDARRHDPRLRAGGPARSPAARPDRRQPRFARQPAGGGRDARAARPRSADARALPGGRARRGRGDDGAPAGAGRRRADGAEDALADGGHARRRPGRGRRAAHRSPRLGAGECRRGRSDALAEGRQLLAAAGARLPRAAGWSTSMACSRCDCACRPPERGPGSTWCGPARR